MSLTELIQSWLSGFNLGSEAGGLLARIVIAAVVLLFGLIALFISRRIVSSGVHLIFKRSRFTWDDYLLESKLFMHLTLIVPALIIHMFIPVVFNIGICKAFFTYASLGFRCLRAPRPPVSANLHML